MITLYFLMALTCVPVNFVTVMAAGAFTAVKNYNETCELSDDCFDDRMVCLADQDNVMRCFCNKYHQWNESIGCVQIYSVAYIMNHTISNFDSEEKLNKLQNEMFLGPFYSIFFMIFVISFCTLSVFAYCYYIRRKDNRLKIIIHHLNEEKAKKERLRSTGLHPQPSTSQC